MATSRKDKQAEDEIIEEPVSREMAAAMANFDAGTMRAIGSFADALALVEERYGDVIDATDEIGTGFAKIEKRFLVDIPFVILHMTFTVSDTYKNPDNGQPLAFVAVNIVTQHGLKGWFVDGGAGIYTQLDEWAVRTNRFGGILVKGGLRESTYDLPDGSGQGTTYYLNV